MLSLISEVPALPANAGAVPATVTFPVTAAPQVAAVLSASEGTLVAHDVVLGSPMMIAEYALNCAVVIASHVDADATVTVAPAAVAAAASALAVPPFTLVDKISTDPDDARAGAAPTAAPTADTATAADTVNATGTSDDPAASTGPSTVASTRRKRHPMGRPEPPAPSPRILPMSHPSRSGKAPHHPGNQAGWPRRSDNRCPIHILV